MYWCGWGVEAEGGPWNPLLVPASLLNNLFRRTSIYNSVGSGTTYPSLYIANEQKGRDNLSEKPWHLRDLRIYIWWIKSWLLLLGDSNHNEKTNIDRSLHICNELWSTNPGPNYPTYLGTLPRPNSEKETFHQWAPIWLRSTVNFNSDHHSILWNVLPSWHLLKGCFQCW